MHNHGCHTIFLALCLTIYTPLFAQEKLKLWTDNPTRQEKWSELNVFLPPAPHSAGIAVVICPGGSYYWLDMDDEGFEVAEYLQQHGIAAFVLHYRTARRGNHHPAMIQDLRRAMQMVQEHAQEYKINPMHIGVMGFSAGGHLAGTMAEYFDRVDSIEEQVPNNEHSKNLAHQHSLLNTKGIKPYFAAMIYPVVSMSDEQIVHSKSRKNLLGKRHSTQMADMLSLEKHVRADMPPVFLLHLTGDKTVDCRNSIGMDKALAEHGVPHKFMLIEETAHGGHGFGIHSNGKASGWIDEFLKWLLTI